MPSPLLVAGLDGRSLLLEAPMLQRERHVVEERAYARDLLQDIVPLGSRLVVLGPRIPDLSLADAIRRIRASPATRHVSILVLIPAADPQELEELLSAAGANAVLRRPLDPAVLERWLAKLMIVPRRVEARVPVQGQVVGSAHPSGAGHFCGLTHNLSINGMLLASPVRLQDSPDLDLEFVIPGLELRLRVLARVVREAPEVAWPYVGYGVEFLFVPPESQEALSQLVGGTLIPTTLVLADERHGIHGTLRREDWIYEIRDPVQRAGGWHVEIRRAPRLAWRPGIAGPFFVVEGATADKALREARDFVDRHG
jgi:CheY-like chemotaxis protein